MVIMMTINSNDDNWNNYINKSYDYLYHDNNDYYNDDDNYSVIAIIIMIIIMIIIIVIMIMIMIIIIIVIMTMIMTIMRITSRFQSICISSHITGCVIASVDTISLS